MQKGLGKGSFDLAEFRRGRILSPPHNTRPRTQSHPVMLNLSRRLWGVLQSELNPRGRRAHSPTGLTRQPPPAGPTPR